MNRSETRDQGNALRAFHPPPSLSIHPSIYLSIVLQGGEEEEFSRQRLENNNNNNNSSKKELVSTDNDIPSLLARFEKRVAGQSLPSDVSLLLHLGYAAASGVRSIPRAPLWLVRRSRVELALLDLSEVLRPDGKSPAAAEEGEKKGTKERNGYRERAGALPGKNEGGGGRRRHEAGTERFPPNNHGNNSQEWNTCQIKGLESSKVPR